MDARKAAHFMRGMALAGVLAGPQVMAGEVKSSGTNVYVTVDREVIPLGKDVSLLRSRSRTVLLADDPESPFHLSPQDCAGTYLLDEDGRATQGNGYCDAVDKDGDIWWLWWKLSGDTSSWGVLGGTGKYAGMTGQGTTDTLSSTPDGRFVLRWEGTWQMK